MCDQRAGTGELQERVTIGAFRIGIVYYSRGEVQRGSAKIALSRPMTAHPSSFAFHHATTLL
jgi:hypothetical protein